MTSTASATTVTAGGFNLSNLLNIFLFRPDINLAATIQALQTQNVLQILAEPNLLTASGKDAPSWQAASFLIRWCSRWADGRPPGITIQFKEFGVRLNFTPTIQPDGLDSPEGGARGQFARFHERGNSCKGSPFRRFRHAAWNRKWI